MAEASAAADSPSAPWRVRAALARAAGVELPADQGPLEEELALLPERSQITAELAAWALGGASDA